VAGSHVGGNTDVERSVDERGCCRGEERGWYRRPRSGFAVGGGMKSGLDVFLLDLRGGWRLTRADGGLAAGGLSFCATLVALLSCAIGRYVEVGRWMESLGRLDDS
jgi:hypothetical protein